MLTIGKFAAGWLSHSVGVLAEGMHSALDLVSALVAFFTVREAIKPADSDHPFGHGKIETLSSVLESVLLLLAAVYITIESLGRFSHPEPIHHGPVAIAVIAISVVLSFFVYRHNLSIAGKTESSAIHVNAIHFLADVLSGLGVLLGLVLILLTGWLVIDPILGLGVAVYITYVSYGLLRSAIGELVDVQLPASEVEVIWGVIHEFKKEFIAIQDLRTRKSGVFRHIDFHLLVCGHMNVSQSHQICDRIEARIDEVFPGASVKIHVEPCAQEKPGCGPVCELPGKVLSKVPSKVHGK